MKKVVFITGGSSGIGLSTAIILSKNGYRVYEMSRSERISPGIIHISGDVTSENSVKSAIEFVMQKESRIDILINNAGFGISGAIEFTDISDAQKQFDVNFFGMARMCSAVLPYMRKAQRGMIINISSVAAQIPIPFQTFYSSSKAAVNSYTLALANEVRPYGISVCAVMPGDIKTSFTSSRQKETCGNEEYDNRIVRSIEKMEKDENSGMSPDKIAGFILKLLKKKTVKPLYTIRMDYKIFVIISRIIPANLLNKIIYKLYAK